MITEEESLYPLAVAARGQSPAAEADWLRAVVQKIKPGSIVSDTIKLGLVTCQDTVTLAEDWIGSTRTGQLSTSIRQALG